MASMEISGFYYKNTSLVGTPSPTQHANKDKKLLLRQDPIFFEDNNQDYSKNQHRIYW
jgi:hypothetical protein